MRVPNRVKLAADWHTGPVTPLCEAEATSWEGMLTLVDGSLQHLCSVLAETAVNIGYSCKMLTDDMTEVFIVTGHTVLEVREELRYAEAVLNCAQGPAGLTFPLCGCPGVPTTVSSLPSQESPEEDGRFLPCCGQRLHLPGEPFFFKTHFCPGGCCWGIRLGHQRAQPGNACHLYLGAGH